MSEFSFLAVSNVEGMRFVRYIKVFGIALLFGVSLFFLIYFIIRYRREKSLARQMGIYDHKTTLLEQDLFVQKIMKASGKLKVSLFIEYLEKFVTTSPYANISELLSSQWFVDKEIQAIEGVLYANQKISKELELDIDKRILTREKK